MGEADPWCIGRRVAVVVSMLLLTGCGAPTTAARPTAPVATVMPLPTLDPGRVAQGRQVYLRNCASCHGQQAEGAPHWQQPDSRGDLPPPPHDDSGHTWRHGDTQLHEIIHDGMRDPFNKTPDLTMPPFKDRLSEQEIDDVLAYMKSLWSPEHRRYQEEQQAHPAAFAGRNAK